MRIPEQQQQPQQRQHRSGQQYQEHLGRYLQPGAFTVLSSENVPPPEPPMAPQPYRLTTPSSRRHKNHSFAIIAEPGNSRPGSRSPSPTGRVSPFRGRGFNPAGSRHASPTASPPPSTPINQNQSMARSKIPKLTRRGSASVFGERINDYLSSPNRRKLHSQLSQSLTNISTTKKPPPSPRRHHQQQQQQEQQQPRQKNQNRSFQRLSPIIGSSPEPSQSQSSPIVTPGKATKPISRSNSRLNSPTRNRPLSNSGGKNSRQTSRDSSPNKLPTSPSRIPVKNNYKNVQSKINSFNNRNNKPKVPPKPQVLTDETTTDSSDVNRGNQTYRTRTESFRKPKTTPKSNLPMKQNNSLRNSRNDLTKSQDNKNANNSRSSGNQDPNGNKLKRKTSNSNLNTDTATDKRNNNNNNVNKSQNSNKNDNTTNRIQNSNISGKSTQNNASSSNGNDNKSNDNDNVVVSGSTESEDNSKSSGTPVKLSDLLQPSTTAVVSSTTTTVTQPLKIDTKLELSLDKPQQETIKQPSTTTTAAVTTTTTTPTMTTKPEPTKRLESRTIAPIVDGRVLSATSVSNAMNKMNDTVLDTQTLMKDHGIPKLSPSANTMITMSNETTGSDAKHSTIPIVGTTNNKTSEINHSHRNNNNNNNNNHITSTGIIPARLLDEHVQNNMAKLIGPDNNFVSNSMGKNINSVVGSDVKPIRITVKEKPMDVEVQSGNIRFDAANGISETPSLPPTQAANPNEQQQETQNVPKRNRCAQFFTNFRNKLQCERCKKPKPNKDVAKDDQTEKTGCFNCCKRKKPDVTINIEHDEPKKKFWERFKCCKSKIGDKNAANKRKNTWAEKQDSIVSGPPTEKLPWWRRICRRNKKPIEDPASRRASMMSKKKSLTSSVPIEDNTPKLDISLVEHNSAMRGAIPVLPVPLAWFCLVMNCIIPGTGTIFSGIFCLCLGIPRFSQKDGPRSRLGAFIIDTIIGIGQCFTVLFCLVGWGWSIWWGVIMLRLARKHRKIKALEAETEKREAAARRPSQQRDIERGT